MTNHWRRTSLNCARCEAYDDFVNDERTGDVVCRQCGVVSRRLFSEQTEYRVFNDDSSSWKRKRIGPSYNVFHMASSPFTPSVSLPHTHPKYDPYDFLREATADIREVFAKLFCGDCTNRPAMSRAIYLFTLAFNHQIAEKTTTDRRRLKFSRRKQFVVSCIWRALIEQHKRATAKDNVKEAMLWTLNDINNKIPGNDVSVTSVQHCLTDLDRYANAAGVDLSQKD